MPELTAPIVHKNEEKRIILGPVLIPDEPDTDNDTVTAEKIEEVAHKFVEDYGNIDLMHSLENVGKMVESYILPYDLPVDDNLTVPKGSWMLGVRVTNDESWEAVKNKQLGGFSIMAIPKVTKSKDSAEKGQSEKRTTIADLEETGDWVVNAVSLVDEPAVPKAKYIAIKSKAKKNVGEITAETVQKAIQGSLEERERLVRRKVYAEFDTERTDSYVHSTFQDSVIIKIFNFLNETEKLYQVGYEIDDQGNVNFTTDLQEVRIEENVVPIDSNINIVKNSDSDSKSVSFLDRIKKSLGIGSSSEKAGRSISNSNLEKLKVAKEVIDDLLSIGEAERANKSNAESEGEDMKQEEVEKMIEKSMSPIKDQLQEVMNTLKGADSQEDSEGEENASNESSEKSKQKDQKENNQSEKSAGKGEEADQGTEEQQDDGQEEMVPKSKLDEALKELENAKKNMPFSRRLAGQDNLDTSEKSSEELEDDRDAFGFKKKK